MRKKRFNDYSGMGYVAKRENKTRKVKEKKDVT